MNRKLQQLFISCNIVGYITLTATRIFRSSLSDFSLGFCEGFSIVCILIGLVYTIWCLAKRKNPYCVQ